MQDDLSRVSEELRVAKVTVDDSLSAYRDELLERLHATETRLKELEAKLERMDRHWWCLW